jgi:hypothetical protein
MKTLMKSTLLAVIALAGMGMTVSAAQINGVITFAGGLTLDTASAGNATEVTGWFNTSVVSADGNFLGAAGMPAVFTAPWQFATPPGPPIVNFWTADGFHFDLQTSVIIVQGFDQNGLGYLYVLGSGIAYGNGFDPTPGNWRFTCQDPSADGMFSFSAAVPEPSTDALLLTGALLVGLAIHARSRRVRTNR